MDRSVGAALLHILVVVMVVAPIFSVEGLPIIPEQYSLLDVHCPHSRGSNTLCNLLFRGNEPRAPEPDKPPQFDMIELMDTLGSLATKSGYLLSPTAKLHVYNFLSFPGEFADIHVGQQFFQSNPQYGQWKWWPISGVSMTPDAVGDAARDNLTASFDQWSVDRFPQLMEEVHQLLRSTPTDETQLVILGHCEGGIDRTGAFGAGYQIAYEGIGVERAIANSNFFSRQLAGRDMETQMKNNILWFASYLKAKEKEKQQQQEQSSRNQQQFQLASSNSTTCEQCMTDVSLVLSTLRGLPFPANDSCHSLCAAATSASVSTTCLQLCSHFGPLSFYEQFVLAVFTRPLFLCASPILHSPCLPALTDASSSSSSSSSTSSSNFTLTVVSDQQAYRLGGTVQVATTLTMYPAPISSSFAGQLCTTAQSLFRSMIQCTPFTVLSPTSSAVSMDFTFELEASGCDKYPCTGFYQLGAWFCSSDCVQTAQSNLLATAQLSGFEVR